MKDHEFLCGGDYGAWETEVTVGLTEEEENILHDQLVKGELHIYRFPPTDKIFTKIYRNLKKQCDGTIDKSSIVIWIPSELR